MARKLSIIYQLLLTREDEDQNVLLMLQVLNGRYQGTWMPRRLIFTWLAVFRLLQEICSNDSGTTTRHEVGLIHSVTISHQNFTVCKIHFRNNFFLSVCNLIPFKTERECLVLSTPVQKNAKTPKEVIIIPRTFEKYARYKPKWLIQHWIDFFSNNTQH